MPSSAIAPPEQRVLLRNVRWETYERLRAENVNTLSTRSADDGGLLEITVVSSGHEGSNRMIVDLIAITALETGVDYWAAGATTFRTAGSGERL